MSPVEPDRVQPDSASAGGEPTMTARLDDGPLSGTRMQVSLVEGRPPKTIDAQAGSEGAYRYCLAEWTQKGKTATYSFLYRV